MNRSNNTPARIRKMRAFGFSPRAIAVECGCTVDEVLEVLRKSTPPKDRTEEKQRAERIRAVEWARREGFDESVIQANFEEAR